MMYQDSSSYNAKDKLEIFIWTFVTNASPFGPDRTTYILCVPCPVRACLHSSICHCSHLWKCLMNPGKRKKSCFQPWVECSFCLFRCGNTMSVCHIKGMQWAIVFSCHSFSLNLTWKLSPQLSKCWEFLQDPGPRLNIKTVLPTYGDFHVKDKTAVRTSYL